MLRIMWSKCGKYNGLFGWNFAGGILFIEATSRRGVFPCRPTSRKSCGDRAGLSSLL